MKDLKALIKANGLRIVSALIFLFCAALIVYTARFITVEEKLPASMAGMPHQTLDRGLYSVLNDALKAKTGRSTSVPADLRDPFSPRVKPAPAPPPQTEGPETPGDTTTDGTSPPADTPATP